MPQGPTPFSRSEMLLGRQATQTLQNSHAAVFGLGGVGSYAAEALARAGVGKLTLVDHDSITPSNLNRQLYALHSTMGKLKTQVAAERIADINPHCTVRALPLFYGEETAHTILKEKPDVIVDAIDTVSAKIHLAVYARDAEIALIACMGTGNKLDAALFRVSDIYKTEVCPLCRVMRRELRRCGVERLPVVWSPEEPRRPLPPQDGDRGMKRSVPGSVPFVPPVAGMLLAGWAVKSLLGTER